MQPPDSPNLPLLTKEVPEEGIRPTILSSFVDVIAAFVLLVPGFVAFVIFRRIAAVEQRFYIF